METTYTPDEIHPPEHAADEQQNDQATPCSASYNKYNHPEFVGFEGERLLKSILRKILPMALYRTWEVLAERQAPGNDCFLSIASISETTQRVEKTIRLNIHELEARKLLVLRPAQKLLPQADGSLKLKLVVVKDFSGLYALALEYLRWTEANGSIPPEREFAEVIRSNEDLKRKLIRFNNYRRIILNKVPGPRPREREEHRWYKEYNAALDSKELNTAEDAQSPLQSNDLRAEEVERESSYAIRKHNLQEQPQKDLKKVSEEQTITNHQNNPLYRDSFESGTTLEEGGGCGYTKNPNMSYPKQEVRGDSHTSTKKTNPTNPYLPTSQGMDGAKQASSGKQAGKKERADLNERAQTFVRQAMAAYQGRQEKNGRGYQTTVPNVKQNALVSAFVREVSSLFYDRNVKGSRTRVLRAVEYTHLSQKAILACLVKAYLVALDTKTVKPQHRHPDGDNKMPLFCTMFARFVDQSATGSFGYSDEHLARDIAADDRLVLFVVENQLEATLLEASVVKDHRDAEQEGSVALREDEGMIDGLGLHQESEPDVQDKSEQLEHQEEQRPWIDAESPDLGWHTDESAIWWADRLRDALGHDHYNYSVCPTQYGRYGFALFQRSDPARYWVFLTEAEVKEYL